MIAFDAATDLGYNGSVGNLTHAHTVTGSSPILYVATEGSLGGSDLITGVTYNAVSMTKVGSSIQTASGRWMALWRLVNPSTGSNNVVITGTGNDVIVGLAASYTGYNSLGTNTSNTGASAGSLTTTLTTTVDNSWAVMLGDTSGIDGSLHPITAGTNTSLRVKSSTDGDLGLLDGGPLTPAGSMSTQFTVSATATGLVGIMEAFSPPAAAGGSVINAIISQPTNHYAPGYMSA